MTQVRRKAPLQVGGRAIRQDFLNLGLTLDSLEELKGHREALRARDLTLTTICKFIQDKLMLLKGEKKTWTLISNKQLLRRNYLELDCTNAKKEMNVGELYQALIKAMHIRIINPNTQPHLWPNKLPWFFGEVDQQDLCNLFCDKWSKRRQDSSLGKQTEKTGTCHQLYYIQSVEPNLLFSTYFMHAKIWQTSRGLDDHMTF